MKLSKLLSSCKLPVPVSGDPEILGLSEDSRTVNRGYLFFARHGAKDSGTRYIQQAIQNGAVGILSDQTLGEHSVPVIQVPSMAKAEAKIADVFYSHPSGKLLIIGVTGTNGKTTFTYLLESVLRTAGWRVGVIGTINVRLPKLNSNDPEILSTPNTTPNALELQKILAEMVIRKTDLVILEVSSHALALGRVEHIDFSGALFTNLTRDHLDFHQNMEQYFTAKSSLFKTLKPGRSSEKVSENIRASFENFCIINSDDAYGASLIALCKIKPMTYGIKNPADFSARDIQLSSFGTQLTLHTQNLNLPIHTPLIGRHNVYNILSAFSAAFQLNLPSKVILHGLQNAPPVPGRLERIVCGQKFTVVVDYAHTDDALRNVLNALKSLAKGRLLTLFGCGGDRDRSKRPLMGSAAVELSDWVVLTSDNPRSEDPSKIALDIEVGIHRTGKTNYEVILDRQKAIQKILKSAHEDDIVLLAGKGHETTQIFKDRTIPFDDRLTAQNILTQKLL